MITKKAATEAFSVDEDRQARALKERCDAALAKYEGEPVTVYAREARRTVLRVAERYSDDEHGWTVRYEEHGADLAGLGSGTLVFS